MLSDPKWAQLQQAVTAALRFMPNQTMHSFCGVQPQNRAAVVSLKLASEIRTGEKQILRSPPPN